MRITKVGVVGAGVMGHGIAALCASAGLPVVLLDIPGSDDPKSPDRSAPAKNGLVKALKNKPAAFMDTDRAALITTGNTADHLELLADCDWICEVIIEQPKPKQELFAKIEQIAHQINFLSIVFDLVQPFNNKLFANQAFFIVGNA